MSRTISGDGKLERQEGAAATTVRSRRRRAMVSGRRLGSKQKQKAARALVRSGKATAWNASDMPAFPRVHQTARRLAQLLALSASPMGVLRSEVRVRVRARVRACCAPRLGLG